MGERTATIHRKTSETDITMTLIWMAGAGASVKTGIGFFDHMPQQLCQTRIF